MNKKLLRKVQRGILKEPKRYKQEIFGVIEASEKECNTAGCIAGWAYAIDLGLLNKRDKLFRKYVEQGYDVSNLAAGVLRLSWDEQRSLFYVDKWPKIFLPFTIPGSEGLRGPKWLQALVAAIRIEVFIWSKGTR